MKLAGLDQTLSLVRLAGNLFMTSRLRGIMGYCNEVNTHRGLFHIKHTPVYYTLYHGVRLRQRVHTVVISRNPPVMRNACL